MPVSTSETPTITRTFAGHEFTVPAPYTEGHVLTAPEASWLNGQVASVVGNAFSGDLRRAEAAKKGATKTWDLPAMFAERYASYALGEGRGSGGGTASGTSALDRTITFLATEDIKSRIAAKGLKVDAFRKTPAQDAQYKSRFVELVAQNIEAKRELFTAQAQAQLDALAASDATDDDFGLPAPVEAQSEAA